MGLDLHGGVTADGHVTFARDAFSAIIGTRQVDVEAASADGDIGVTLDGRAVRRVVVFNHSASARCDGEVAASDGNIVIAIDAF